MNEDLMVFAQNTDLEKLEEWQYRLDKNPAAVYLSSLSKGSRRTMKQALNVICGLLSNNMPDPNQGLVPRDKSRIQDNRCLFLPWHNLRYEHTAVVRAELQELYSFNTANKTLSALRGVLKAAWNLGLIESAEQYRRAISVKNIDGETIVAGRHVPKKQVRLLLKTCDQKEKADIRDAAIIAILYRCGLRRNELVDLDLSDYDKENHHLRVKGKGNKERLVYVAGMAVKYLDDWLDVRGNLEGPIFVGMGYNNTGNRLTTQAIYEILKVRIEKAGIPDLSPHDFRRTFIGDLLDADVDIVTAQKLVGHKNVETTARYDRRGEGVKREAVNRIDIPYWDEL